MPRKILRRCSICNNFHAAYLVQDPRLGKLLVCYSCWKSQYAGRMPEPPDKAEHSAEDQPSSASSGDAEESGSLTKPS